MIPTASFSCTIPSTDAIKAAALHCTGAASDAPAIWAAVAGIVTAIATIGLVIGAFVAWHTARKTLEQTKADSIAQTRPYVFAKLVPSIAQGGAWDLVISNSGRSSALGLTIESSAWPDDDAVVAACRKMFETPQTLPPGTSLRTYWQLSEKTGNRKSDPAGINIPTVLTMHYRGSGKTSEPYTDSYQIDPNSMGLTPQGGEGIVIESKDPIVKRLSEVVRAINETRWGS